MELTISEKQAKELLKEVLVELLQEKRALFFEVMVEAIEEIGLASAIREGRQDEFVSEEEILARAKNFERAGADALYLMTTASFDFNRFIDLGKKVKKSLSSKIPLVANIDDFGSTEAQELRDVGFTAIYHAVRLREGKDTKIDPKTRIATIQNAKKVGLKTVIVCRNEISDPGIGLKPNCRIDNLLELLELVSNFNKNQTLETG